MPNQNPQSQNFATLGTESFKLPENEKKEHIILNIQEEPKEGIILERGKNKKRMEVNPFMEFYHTLNKFFVSHSKIKIKEKATFFHLLSVMINAGMPMVRALRSLGSQMEKTPRLQLIIETIADDIEAGTSLSESFLRHPDIFLEQEVGMVQAGEASGRLAKVLDNLATDTEKVYSIKSKVKGAMMYPIVIMSLLVLVVAGMMIFVIPSLKSLFTSTNAELPLLTRVVVGTSDFMVAQKFTLLLGIVILICFFYLFKKTDIGKYYFDKFKISVPIFGALFQKSYLSRFARSLSNLLDSDISIVRAIEITGNSIGNEVYRRRLLMSMEDVRQGIPLAESISESSLFPPMLVNMVDVGEKTAQLDEISAKVAEFYEQEVDIAVNGISKVIEPIILIIIGAVVGVVVAAIMLPIVKLADLSGAM